MNGVDFAFSFATPHRITLSRPASSKKALVDVMPEGIVLKYSNDSCKNSYPLTWRILNIDVETFMNVSVDGETIDFDSWHRHESGAPYLFVRGSKNGVSVTVSAIATKSGYVIKTDARNSSSEGREVHIQFALTNLGHVSNKGWVDGVNNDILLAMSKGRADKVIALGCGADDYLMYRFTDEGTIDRPPMSNESFKLQPHSKKKITPYLHLSAEEEKCSYIYLPYDAYFKDKESLKAIDFESEISAALDEWKRHLSRSAKFDIPDEGMKHVLNSCIADIFVMREKTGKGGRYAINCGTDVYRSSNSYEPTLAERLIESLGYVREAASDMNVYFEAQNDDGCWASERCWEHEMWGAPYFKASLAYHHYSLSEDRDFLEKIYERMYRSSIFNRDARRSTRNAERAFERGLMPRGMGDSGLQNGGDFYGVYYPPNFLTVAADMITLKCARILGKIEDIPILEELISEAREALLKSVRENAVKEDGYIRIPAIAGIPENSTFGCLFGYYPTGLLSADDPLITGTVNYIESKQKSEGGLPMGTGWLRDGIWVAMALDNFAAAYLRMGKVREAREYLYPAANHASPLVTWCEERGNEAGATKKTGDPQHLWTPLSIGAYMVDALFMDRDDGYTLFAGILPEWLDEGAVGVRGLRTSLGKTNLSIKKTQNGYRLRFNCEREPKGNIYVSIPTPEGARTVTFPPSKNINNLIK